MLTQVKKIFVITPYYIESDGKMSPVVPAECPCHSKDKRPCKMVKNHDRDRKTGPMFPIRVMHCSTHGINFTLYPPGFVPYGRTKLGPVELDGMPSSQSFCVESYAGTYFDAAIDAADGKPWPRESFDGSLKPRFTTQCRHIERIMQLLAINQNPDMDLVEIIAQILWIPGQLLLDNIKLTNTPSFQIKGLAVCNVLNEIPSTQSIFTNLIEAGSVVGLWSEPYVWNPSIGIYQIPPLRNIRNRASPG